MSEPKSFSRKLHVPVWLYALTVLLFLGSVGRFYEEEAGFTSLICFGDQNAERFIPEVKALPLHVQERSFGYDAQWYVQIAVRPNVKDPAMMEAIDSLPYRARRSLLSWTAFLLGFGQPAWIVQVYALLNVACWLALAWLLLRWFPADGSFGSYFRWAAVLLSYGVMVSVRASLVDAPSLLLIAGAVALIEQGRRGWATAVMAAAGLGKETNLCAAGSLVEWDRAHFWRSVAWSALRGVLVVAPLAFWTSYIIATLGPVGADTGLRAFALPFSEYLAAVKLIAREWISGAQDRWVVTGAAVSLISLTTQWLFLVLRPRWREVWWRVAMGYAALMVVLGEAVWEGYPGAASRVLLPMLLAFNVLVPKTARWWPVLILGNLTVLTTPDLLRVPGGRGYELQGPSELRQNAATASWVAVTFDEAWLPAEKTWWDYWRWARGNPSFSIANPHSESIKATLAFTVSCPRPSHVRLMQGERSIWEQKVDRPRVPGQVPVDLGPGQSELRFEVVPLQPPGPETAPVQAGLSLRLYDLKVELAK